MKIKDWKIIINHFDLNERIQVGFGNSPKLINQEVNCFDTKDELILKYHKIIDKYMKKSYDWKSHGQGAMKFYYEDNNGNDIYTLILAHYKNNEIDDGLFE